MMGEVLVTGANGFLGSHTVYQLLDRGYTIRGTVRNPQEHQWLFKLHPKALTNLQLIAADLLKEEGWAEAVSGVSLVLHIASPFHMGCKEEDIVPTAVEGTRRVLTAAGKAGVHRVVVTSSIASICFGHDAKVYQDENLLFDENVFSVAENCNPYEKSKTLAELEAWMLSRQYGFELLTVNPGFIVGPALNNYHKNAESISFVRDMFLKHPGLVDLRAPYVDVRDVAALHIRVMEWDVPDARDISRTVESYHKGRFVAVSDTPEIPLADIADILNQNFAQLGYKTATRKAPNMLVKALGLFSAYYHDLAQIIGQPHPFTNRKSKECFDIEYTSVEKSLVDQVLSMCKHKMLDARHIPSERIDAFTAY